MVTIARPDGTALAYKDGELTVTAIRVAHDPVSPAFAYRFDYKGRSVVVSGDTRNWPPLAVAAKGADVLVHEAQNNGMTKQMAQGLAMLGNPRMSSIMGDTVSYHTEPVEAANLARAAGVKALVLSHLSQAGLPFYTPEAFTKGIEDGGKLDWRLAADGMTIDLPVGSAEVRYGLPRPARTATVDDEDENGHVSNVAWVRYIQDATRAHSDAIGLDRADIAAQPALDRASVADAVLQHLDADTQVDQRVQCGLLVDVNNLYVNALNAQLLGEHGEPLQICREWLDQIPAAAVAEAEVAGREAERRVGEHETRVGTGEAVGVSTNPAPVAATQRAVKLEAFSSWSARRTRARRRVSGANSGFPTCGPG